MFSSPSRSKRKNHIFACVSPFSVANIISAFRSASSSSNSQRITKRNANQQHQQHLAKIKDAAFSPFSTSSAFLEQVKKLPNNSIEKLTTLENQMNSSNLTNLLSINQTVQRQSSILLLPPPPSPWCYVCRDENSFQNQQSDENEKLFISLKFSERCSVRAFVSKEGAVGTETKSTNGENTFEIDPELTRHRISGPLKNLFQNFPDLVLEGNIVVPFEIASEEFTSLPLTSLLTAKNVSRTIKNKNVDLVKKLLSSSNDFGLQFFVYDIAYWCKFGSNNNNNHNNSSSFQGVPFEVRMSMLQKMLKSTVDPNFSGFLTNSDGNNNNNNNNNNNVNAMQDLVQQFENHVATGAKQKEDCLEDGSEKNFARTKSIVFLGNVTLDDRRKSIQERNKKVEELLNVVVGEDEHQPRSSSLFLDGVALHHSSTTSGFFTHVHREESDFEVVKFISSNFLSGDDDEEDEKEVGKVAGFECVTVSGEKFVAPLTGVSDEIRKQLWEKRHVLLSSLRKKTSTLFATVEYSEILKNSVPKEPLAKKIKGR